MIIASAILLFNNGFVLLVKDLGLLFVLSNMMWFFSPHSTPFVPAFSRCLYSYGSVSITTNYPQSSVNDVVMYPSTSDGILFENTAQVDGTKFG